MYRDADGDMLALLAPQLALMLAIEGSVQPVVGASDRTSAYIQTLTATAEEIHASSQEVAASARRASEGAAQAAGLVTALARDSDQLTQHAVEVAAAGAETRDSGAQMEQTTEKVRLATQTAVRRLTELGVTTEESAREVGRLREVAEQVEKFSKRSASLRIRRTCSPSTPRSKQRVPAFMAAGSQWSPKVARSARGAARPTSAGARRSPTERAGARPPRAAATRPARNHCEPAAMNAGTRCFDRGVEGEQVRLIRNEADRFRELLDLLRHLPQPPYLARALFGGDAQLRQATDGRLGREGGTFSVVCSICAPESRVSAPAAATSTAC